MPTKAQVIKASRLKVHKVAGRYYRLLDAVKQAEKDLTQAHKDFEKKTGISWGEFQSQKTMRNFRRRVGKVEATRLDNLAACHDLANAMLKEHPELGIRECQRRAWKKLGWNADCSKRLKGCKPKVKP